MDTAPLLRTSRPTSPYLAKTSAKSSQIPKYVACPTAPSLVTNITVGGNGGELQSATENFSSNSNHFNFNSNFSANSTKTSVSSDSQRSPSLLSYQRIAASTSKLPLKETNLKRIDNSSGVDRVNFEFNSSSISIFFNQIKNQNFFFEIFSHLLH